MKFLNLKTQSKNTLSASSQIVFDYLIKAAWHPDTIEIADEAIAKNSQLDIGQVSNAITELETTGFIITR